MKYDIIAHYDIASMTRLYEAAALWVRASKQSAGRAGDTRRRGGTANGHVAEQVPAGVVYGSAARGRSVDA